MRQDFKTLCMDLSGHFQRECSSWTTLARLEGRPDTGREGYEHYKKMSRAKILEILLNHWTEPKAFFEATHAFMGYENCLDLHKRFLGMSPNASDYATVSQVYPYERSHEIWGAAHHLTFEPWTFWVPGIQGLSRPTLWEHLLDD